MAKYRVSIPYCAYVTVEVEASDAEQAESLAFDYSQPTGFAGNGGSDRLIGVGNYDNVKVSIEAGEGSIEGGFTKAIEVDKCD
mgnify:CR=1 FL=1